MSGAKGCSQAAREMRLESGFEPTCIAHPDTYLNKVLVGSRDGRMQLWNFASAKMVYEVTLPPQCVRHHLKHIRNHSPCSIALCHSHHWHAAAVHPCGPILTVDKSPSDPNVAPANCPSPSLRQRYLL